MSTRSKIQKLLTGNSAAQEFLDGLVHEHASVSATAVNNNGLKDQLEFLNQRGETDEDVLKALQMALGD